MEDISKILDGVVIAVDFDGTIVDHAYPSIGDPVPLAIETLHVLSAYGAALILFTVRSGRMLDHADQYLKENGVYVHGLNVSPGQELWTSSPKVNATMFIDDRALGCPLIQHPVTMRPCVDWKGVRKSLTDRFGIRFK